MLAKMKENGGELPEKEEVKAKEEPKEDNT